MAAWHPARESERIGRVGLVTGCVMSVLFDSTHRSTIRLLNAAGYDVVVPPGQGCCGALHAHGGNLAAARAAARHNLEAFDTNLDAIIVNAAGCGSTLKEYGHLLASDAGFADRAAAFSAKVRDLTEVLTASERFTARLREVRVARSPQRVTCHEACHLAHAQKLTEPPRKLVKMVAAAGFVELPEADVCCGSAGSYNLTEPDMAGRLQQRKIRNIAELGPVTVITTNPGCILQIDAGLRAAGLRQARVAHIADWLVEYLDAPAEG
jgi:glycolate oxidase iron-sulfur subunit